MLPENVRSVFAYGQNVDLVLFKNAFNFAEDGRNVWFISPKPITELPSGIDPPDKQALKLITFLYIKDYKQLLKHINGIHVWHKVPELIILNSFHSYSGLNCNGYDSTKSAFLCASLLDAASGCGKKLSKVIYVLVASNEQSPDVSKLQILIDLYFHDCLDVSSNVNYLVSST